MADYKKVQIRVSGSSANLGPGFDTLGMAINLFLTVTAQVKKGKPILELSGEGSTELPTDATNLVYQSYIQYGEYFGQKLPSLHLSIDNQIPLKRGLGSSSAAIVTGLLLGQAFNPEPVSRQELVNIASSIEGHPDNVTTCLMGGITVSCNVESHVLYHYIHPPEWIKLVAVIPDLIVETKKARAILPKQVALKDAIYNVQRTALLVARFHSSKTPHIGPLFEDSLHQNCRKHLIPGFDHVFKAAYLAGATAVYLSGSGPTIIALFSKRGKYIGECMVQAFAEHNVSASAFLLRPVSKRPVIRKYNCPQS
ncbi:MAG: homoserine kinase [Patescibacteria group bacterium]|nr:homoserine kinase [Patescibacteria group bacterium]